MNSDISHVLLFHASNMRCIDTHEDMMYQGGYKTYIVACKKCKWVVPRSRGFHLEMINLPGSQSNQTLTFWCSDPILPMLAIFVCSISLLFEDYIQWNFMAMRERSCPLIS